MDREQALKLLGGRRNDVEEWNRLQVESERMPDLSHAKLSGANLNGANLNGANLSNASLSQAIQSIRAY